MMETYLKVAGREGKGREEMEKGERQYFTSSQSATSLLPIIEKEEGKKKRRTVSYIFPVSY